MESTYDVILKRRSIRTYIDKEISDEIIDKLLKAAMAAPSACNKRPWEFYVIKNVELRNKLQKVSRYSDREAPLIIIVAGNKSRALSQKENDFWIQDCSAAVENILLCATEENIATCWCGLYPMVTSVKRVKEILELTDNIIPLAMIHLGYSDEEGEPRTQYDEERVHKFE